MRIRIDGAAELPEKAGTLLEHLAEQLPDGMAAVLHKAAHDLEPVKAPREPVLRELFDRWQRTYDQQMQMMVGEIGQVLDQAVVGLSKGMDESTAPEGENWVELPEDVALLLLDEQAMVKGFGHKYIRRIANPNPPPKYRYFYNVTGGQGIGHASEFQPGAAFAFEHEGKRGHYHVHKVEAGTVHARHDESGHELQMQTEEFSRHLRGHHSDKIKAAIAKVAERRQKMTAGLASREEKLRAMFPEHFEGGANQPAAQDAPQSPKSAEPAPLSQASVEMPGQGQAQGPAKTFGAPPTAKQLERMANEGLPATAPELPVAEMTDLGGGQFDAVEAFSTDRTDLERQAAVGPRDKEFAVVQQPHGWVLVSRSKAHDQAGKVDGANTDVFLRNDSGSGIKKYKARWVVMEADQVIASHHAGTFGKDPRYPEGVQERRYDEKLDEQLKVDKIARTMEPAFLVNSNPDAVNGAPIITEKGIVLGGNGRTMGVKRAYDQYPESAQKMREYLMSQAPGFGISRARIQKMKQPILVRQMVVGDDKVEMTRLGRRMNEALTQGLDPSAEQVAISKFVTPAVVEALATKMEPDQTLDDFLDSAASQTFVKDLHFAGIIDDYNRSQFVDSRSGLLNDNGRNRIKRVLAARMIPDPTLLDAMGNKLRSNLAIAMPFILTAEVNGWNIQKELTGAVEADLEMVGKGYPRTARGRDQFQQQLGLFGGMSHREKVSGGLGKLLLEIIQERNGPRLMQQGFQKFAMVIDRDKKDSTQGAMFGAPKAVLPPMEQALADSFGLKVDKPKPEHKPEGPTPLPEQPREPDLLAASMPEWMTDLVKAHGKPSPAARQRLAMHTINYVAEFLAQAAVRDKLNHGTAIDRDKLLGKLVDQVYALVEGDKQLQQAMASIPGDGTVLGQVLDTQLAILGQPTGELEKAQQMALFPHAKGPFIGPKGGKWADADHTQSWKEPTGDAAPTRKDKAALTRERTGFFAGDAPADEKKKPGTYYNPDTKDWDVVLYPDDPSASESTREHRKHINSLYEKEGQKLKGIAAAVKTGVMEFREPGSDRYAALLPDASEPGKWRFSSFDPRGFSGHRSFDTRVEAMREMMREGYHEPAGGTLDKLVLTDEWREGMLHNKLTQTANSLTYQGHYDAYQAVNDFVNRHGLSQATVDVIHKRPVLDALYRGEIPDELKKADAELSALEKARGGPFIGPRGGQWADPGHTQHYTPPQLSLFPAGPVDDEQQEARENGVDLAGYFPSGSNHPGEIAGFAQLGWNVGVTASEIGPAAEHVLRELAGHGTKVFLDSGAFSEVAFGPDGPRVTHPITDEQWGQRLDLYQRLGESLGQQLYAVAPDQVGNQRVTLERLERYQAQLEMLRAKGVNLLVPLQKGEIDLADFDRQVSAVLGSSAYVRAIPMKKDATTTDDLRHLLQERPMINRVHLLGLGPKSERYPEVRAMLAREFPHVAVTTDSVAITAAVGRTGGQPRKLTAAQDKVRAQIADQAFNYGPVWDYTDHIGQPGEWLSPKGRQRVAEQLAKLGYREGLSDFVADPDSWLQQEQRYLDPAIEHALDREWKRYLVGEFTTDEKGRPRWVGGEGTTDYRKRESIVEAFGPKLAERAADPAEWKLPAGARVDDPWQPKPPDPDAKWSHPDYGSGDGTPPWSSPDWAPDMHSYDYLLVNSSAGKDSQAMLARVVELADIQGVPRSKIVVVHADLGRADWSGTADLARRQAEHYGVRFELVRREKNDLLDQIAERHGDLVQREADAGRLAGTGIRTWGELAAADPVELAGIIGDGDTASKGLSQWDAVERARKLQVKARNTIAKPTKKQLAGGKPIAESPIDFGVSVAWPSSSARFCTSDHKRVEIQKLQTRLSAEHRGIRDRFSESPKGPARILNMLGIRMQESSAREQMPTFEREDSSGRKVIDRWYPIHLWPETKVWDTIKKSGVPHHQAYDLGMRRLSCVFCVFASKPDLMLAAKHNPDLFRKYLALEQKVGASFRSSQSLADVAAEIERHRAEGYDLNELAEWVKKSLGLDLDDALIKADLERGGPPVLLLLEAARQRMEELLAAVTLDWKPSGVCIHLDTERDSHHVLFVPYPAAYNASMVAALFAEMHSIGLEEHNAPQPGLTPDELEKAEQLSLFGGGHGRGAQRQGHKYIKREGDPGHYQYTYPEDAKPEQPQHEEPQKLEIPDLNRSLANNWAMHGRYEGPLLLSMNLEKAEHTLRGIGNHIEHCAVFQNGQMVRRIAGIEGVCPIPDNIKPGLKDTVFTHPHATGSSFSAEDIGIMVTCDLKEMRATTPDGVWVMTRPDSGWPTNAYGIMLWAYNVCYTKAAESMDAIVVAAGGKKGEKGPGYSDEKWYELIAEEQRTQYAEAAEKIGAKFRFDRVAGSDKPTAVRPAPAVPPKPAKAVKSKASPEPDYRNTVNPDRFADRASVVAGRVEAEQARVTTKRQREAIREKHHAELDAWLRRVGLREVRGYPDKLDNAADFIQLIEDDTQSSGDLCRGLSVYSGMVAEMPDAELEKILEWTGRQGTWIKRFVGEIPRGILRVRRKEPAPAPDWTPAPKPKERTAPRTGAIKIPEKTIRMVADAMMANVPVDKRGQVRWQSGSANNATGAMTLKTARGEEVLVPWEIKFVDQVGSVRGAQGKQHNRISWQGDKLVNHRGLTIEVERILGASADEVGRKVRSTLAHELTHAADPWVTDTALKNAKLVFEDKPEARENPDARNAAEYFNSPGEVSARLQEVARDLMDRRSAKWLLTEHKAGNRVSPEKYLDTVSHLWAGNDVNFSGLKSHLNPENRKRFLKMAARIVEGIKSGDLAPIEKALAAGDVF